ncbi:unnamed protein product [Cladocopium goreaui]|uniref:Uncharacterized protein n=1 Tax=Cladocopium goreaui TaxID=2562237 RepID=A0A9P1C565_9DINO|nr:unnamed protein product [Cladocopium goreaui]
MAGSLFDYYFIVVLLYGLHYLLMEVWRLLGRPTVITLLTTLMWLVAPVITRVPMLDMPAAQWLSAMLREFRTQSGNVEHVRLTLLLSTLLALKAWNCT